MVEAGMSELHSKLFSSRPVLDAHLAQDVVDALKQALAQRGQAILVVSGGSTPVHFFQILSRQSLDWGKVVITLADDRWVEPGHSDSNEKLVRENLLVNEASAARFLPLKNDADTPQAGEKKLESTLQTLGKFSVVILGMGADGHTASLFPGASALLEGLDLESGRSCIGVTPLTAPYGRMSLTLPRLLDTNHLIVHITGGEKKAVFERADAVNDPQSLPISAVIHQDRVPVTLYWAE
jgi:6-phosphogluconolactonase